MNTKNKKSTTEIPSSQGGVICRFDFVSKSIKLYNDIELLANKIGRTIQHTKTLIEEIHLMDNRYVFYYLDEIINGKSQSSFRVKLPKRQIQKIIANETQKTTKIILNSLKDFVGGNFKGVLIYVLNEEGKVVNLLEGHKAASEYFKISVGTVKSRLHRIKDFENSIKYKMCKKSVFDSFYQKIK